MHKLAIVTAFVLLFCTGSARAQSNAPGVYAGGVQKQFQEIQALVMKTAEKVGEELYPFKPTPEVRSLGGVLGHAADGNMLLCRVAAGEKVDFDAIMKGDLASIQINEKKTAKADLISALKESGAYCDSVFAKLTDTTGMETVAWFGGEKMPKLLILTMAMGHLWEHYGNLVTYMRLKGIVPPSSEPSGNGGQ
jgi:uncharacterized damage-inducible protein DinB